PYYTSPPASCPTLSQSYFHLRFLPSFPTRRSSDLMSLVNVIPAVSTYAVAVPGAPGKPAEVRLYDGNGDRFVATVIRRTSAGLPDRKSTRLNSSHVAISYAVFCL